MGRQRRAFAKGVGEAQAEAIIKYAVSLDDETFDQWLLLVVNKRAANGSERAAGMIEFAKEADNANAG